MEPLSNLDVIILICMAISMLIAFLRGFMSEVLSVLGFILFVILVYYLSPILQPWMNKYIVSKLLAQIVIFLIIMAVFYAIWIVSTDKLISRVRTSTLSFMDRLFGLIFGLLRGLLILGFCFLIVLQTLPEMLKEKEVKESRFFLVAKTSSDIIEKLLPDSVIKDSVKFIEDMNKVEEKKKEDTSDKKESSKEVKNEESVNKKEETPSTLDQKELDNMYEKLVNPDVKADKKDKPKKPEEKGYDKKETQNLDRLINLTTKE